MVSISRHYRKIGLCVLVSIGVWLGPGYYRQYRQRILWEEIFAAPEGPVAKKWDGIELLPWDVAQKKADNTLASMTQEEKYSLLKGFGWGTTPTSFFDPDVSFFVGNIPSIPRLGVPALKMHDASSGFRPTSDVFPGTTTCFPSMLALAATWDEQVVEEVATAIATEYRGKGANILLGPSIQVHRTAWGGRNSEYLSGEDPYLGSRLTRAYVRAVQGQGVMAVAKHWAFNEQETNRHTYNVNVDARTAWELYYPPFEAAVEAGVCAVMCAYNMVNGTHACTNEELLVRDLKGIMGFHGFVQSDWWATYTYSDAVEHGLDQSMPGNDGVFSPSALSKLKPSAIDDAARRILAATFRMRLDEHSGCEPPNCKSERKSQQKTAQHQAIAGMAATKSVTLLKNDGILPLTSESVKKILIVGKAATADPWSDEFVLYYSVGGSGHVKPGSITTIAQSIQDRAMRAGMTVMIVDTDVGEAIKAAADCDVVVAVVGTSSTEAMDRDNFDQSAKELQMSHDADNWISSVAALKPTVVLMQNPGAVMMPWLNEVPAVANVFQPGEGVGSAWAAVLFGDVSPGGKLPIMFPATLQDTIRPDASGSFAYDEGLFTSYRNPNLKVAFPFGHGLSYTVFKFGTPQLVKKSECLTRVCVRLAVSNVGNRSGTEVVQAYLEFETVVDMPKRILRGFHKTRVLQPGESENVLFSFTSRDLSTYSVTNSGWLVQDHVRAHFGASSLDIRHELPLYRIGDSGHKSDEL